MTTPPDEPKKPKKRTQFGKSYRPPKRISAEQQKRKVDAWMEFIKPDDKSRGKA